MKALSKLVLAVIGLSIFGQATAQMHDHGHGTQVTMSSTTSTSMSDGIVRKVEHGSNKIIFKHDNLKNLKNLGMGPMTMGFLVKDPSIFNRITVGDEVKFVG